MHYIYAFTYSNYTLIISILKGRCPTFEVVARIYMLSALISNFPYCRLHDVADQRKPRKTSDNNGKTTLATFLTVDCTIN